MRKAHFKTIMSDNMFMNSSQILDSSCYAGQIGQWQNDYPEVADKDKRSTSKLWIRNRTGLRPPSEVRAAPQAR